MKISESDKEYLLSLKPEDLTFSKLIELFGDKLPDNLRKRAEHFYTEFDRVLKGKELWRNGDIEGFGKLVLESGRSSIVNYESGSPLLIDLYNIIATTKKDIIALSANKFLNVDIKDIDSSFCLGSLLTRSVVNTKHNI